jgi:hypothetical protein
MKTGKNKKMTFFVKFTLLLEDGIIGQKITCNNIAVGDMEFISCFCKDGKFTNFHFGIVKEILKFEKA